ncbi:MAG: acyltransferase [Rhodobacteraceae bacterium]|nr:acyltransferase [Paracoccaceae bacterium]
MLGTWRLILALLVVNGHLFSNWWAASYAVFSFYVVSGYLMTFILNETYGFSLHGFTSFWRGRLLRLLPSYWVGCLISIALILTVAPDILQAWNYKLVLPTTAHEIFSNATMIGILHPSEGIVVNGVTLAPTTFSTLVPPAWALSIEIFFYLALSLFFSRSAQHGAILLAFGIVYMGWSMTSAHSKYFSYFFFPAGALPFAVGILTYFALRSSEMKNLMKQKNVIVLSFSSYFIVFATAYALPSLIKPLLIANIATTTAVLAVLTQVRAKESFRKLDRFLGDLSYPTYLFHWQIGFLVFLATGFERNTLPLMLLSTPLILLAAIADRKFVSGPIDDWRRATDGQDLSYLPRLQAVWRHRSRF